MIPAQPIPINGYGNGKQTAGSAFMVSGNGKAWLVTCVHNVTLMKETPVSAFDPQSSIYVLGTNVTISGIGKRTPGLVRMNNTSILADCMSIQLSTNECNALNRFGTFLLADVASPLLNDAVTFAGFPGMAQRPIPASFVQTHVSQIVGFSIAVNNAAIPGYSGGPLYTNDRLLGVMHGDLGKAPNFTSGVAISLYDVRGFLFP